MSLGLTLAVLGAAIATIAGVGSAIGVGIAGEAADEATLRDLEFAWRALRSPKSNAILLADNGAAVGIGMGQVNRVDSCKLSVERANTLGGEGNERARGAVAASDAFFPFADGPAGAAGRRRACRRAPGRFDPRRGSYRGG